MPGLLIEVRTLTGRFHGAGVWPPAPFRLFQALVAGARGGRWAGEKGEAGRAEAFAWLERQGAPLVFAPDAPALSALPLWVPNNDLDAKGGDPAKVGEIRSRKVLRPRVWDPALPVAYLWPETDTPPAALPRLVGRLHTLGLGIDAAAANARVLTDEEAAGFISDSAPGLVRHEPTEHASGDGWQVPVAGSYGSLVRRHEAFTQRLERDKARTRFRQPPPAHARAVVYDAPPDRLWFRLARVDDPARLAAVPQTKAVAVAEAVGNLLAERLCKAGLDEAVAARTVIGRNGASPDEARARVRIVPLPSIGHAQADPSIRRALVEVPQASPLRADAVRDALSGQVPGEGPLQGTLLLATDPDGVTDAYLTPACTWRTVTPAVLPGHARASAEGRRLRAALRHAGVDVPVTSYAVRREPFGARQRLARESVSGTRFASDADRWGRDDDAVHVELTFARPVAGPLLVGDGRWLGLGLMRPVAGARRNAPGVLALGADAPIDVKPSAFLTAVRRAMMATAQDALGTGQALPRLVSGHEAAGAPSRPGAHGHVFLRPIMRGDRLYGAEVIAPWLCDPASDAVCLREAFEGLCDALSHGVRVRIGAGPDVRVALKASVAEAAPMASRFRFATPFVTTRRPRRGADRASFVADDVARELRRRGLPALRALDVAAMTLRSDGRLACSATFELAAPIRYVQLGWDCHRGGGVGAPLPDEDGRLVR